jgi:predicted acetyltransferase
VTDDISIQVPTADDWDAYAAVLFGAFHEDPDDKVKEVERGIFEPERGLVARREGAIVGTAAVLTRRLSVPGATVPAGHVTFVAVAASARRQGVLTRFMHQQLSDIRTAGEPVAILWASEGRIYQRFGYGSAARRLSLSIDTREVRLNRADTSGRLRESAAAELRDAIIKVYDETHAQRPGWSERAERHWDYRLADPEPWRRGATALRAVVHEGDHGVDGYALWRVAGKWDESGPAGEVRILEHVATNPGAYAALWRFLLAMDLTRTTSIWVCSVDEPLQFMVNEPRRLGARMTDGLWVRIVDVPAALSARRYPVDVDLVLEVTDDLVSENAGRWHLTGSPESATCVATTAPADLTLDISALGAAYLGGTPLDVLAAGGFIGELTPGALDAATTAFSWPRTPSPIEVF